MTIKSKQVTVSLRLPEELKEALELISHKEHWSFNQSVVESVKLMIKTQTKTP